MPPRRFPVPGNGPATPDPNPPGPGGLPPSTGPLAFLDSMAVVSVAAGVAAVLLVFTPLGRHPLIRILLPLAGAVWKPALATGAAAWAIGMIPRFLSGRPSPLDSAALALLLWTGKLLLWALVQLVRLLAGLPGIRAVARPLLALLRRTPPTKPTPAPDPEPRVLVPSGPPLSLLPSNPSGSGERPFMGPKVVAGLAEQGIAGAVPVSEITGPTVARVNVQLPVGIRARQVYALADDLAVTLGVPSVSIRPVVGKQNTVAVEVPLGERRKVFLREVLGGTEFQTQLPDCALPIVVGIDTSAIPTTYDLAQAPHMLVAGATGTGKSVFLNTLLLSLLYTRTPEELRLLLVDPKRVEFGRYRGLPHLILPPVDDIAAVPMVLDWLIAEMEARYEAMMRAGAERIKRYNAMASGQGFEPFPYVVLVVDELADLVLQNRRKRRKKAKDDADEDPPDMEDQILRLAQKARAAGIHLVLATQRPSVDVITGTIKANVDARVAFRVSSQVDSKVILDEPGAEKLAGRGDLLFRAPGADMIRAQAPLVGEDAVERVIRWWADHWHGPVRQLLVPLPAGRARPPGPTVPPPTVGGPGPEFV